jgi:hypothetical protein
MSILLWPNRCTLNFIPRLFARFFFLFENCIWIQVDLTRLSLRLCSVGTIHSSKWNITPHHLRDARLAVHVVTVAIDLVLLVATSFPRVLGHLWAGYGLILAPRSPALRLTFFRERCLSLGNMHPFLILVLLCSWPHGLSRQYMYGVLMAR